MQSKVKSDELFFWRPSLIAKNVNILALRVICSVAKIVWHIQMDNLAISTMVKFCQSGGHVGHMIAKVIGTQFRLHQNVFRTILRLFRFFGFLTLSAIFWRPCWFGEVGPRITIGRLDMFFQHTKFGSNPSTFS